MTAHSKVESDEGTHCAFFYGMSLHEPEFQPRYPY